MNIKKIEQKVRELVEATLVIGARRANDKLIHDTALPLVGQHIPNLSKRFLALLIEEQNAQVSDTTMLPNEPKLATKEEEREGKEVDAEALHPSSRELLSSFFESLVEKMIRSQQKYGYSNEWETNDWEDVCRRELRLHLEKGDPKDVAIYAAFMWKRGWSTSNKEREGAKQSPAENIRISQLEAKAKDLSFEWFNEHRKAIELQAENATLKQQLSEKQLEVSEAKQLAIDAREWWQVLISQSENDRLYKKYNLHLLTDEVIINMYLIETGKRNTDI